MTKKTKKTKETVPFRGDHKRSHEKSETHVHRLAMKALQAQKEKSIKEEEEKYTHKVHTVDRKGKPSSFVLIKANDDKHAERVAGRIVGNNFPDGFSVAKIERLKEETINELDKSTLSSYIKKASDSRADNQLKVSNASDAVKNPDLKSWQRKKLGNELGTAYRKVINRRAGINKAADKLATEETQIDEISSEKASSYLKKNIDAMMKGRNYKKSEKYGGLAIAKMNPQIKMRPGAKVHCKEETITEVLSASMPIDAWYHELKHNAKYRGIDDARLKRMAIAKRAHAKVGHKVQFEGGPDTPIRMPNDKIPDTGHNV